MDQAVSCASLNELTFPPSSRVTTSPSLTRTINNIKLEPSVRGAMQSSVRRFVGREQNISASGVMRFASVIPFARALGDKVYQALAVDAVEQGVETPLPPRSALTITRGWTLGFTFRGGCSYPGSMVAVVSTSLRDVVRGFLSSAAREKLEMWDLWVSAHEATHAIGASVVARMQRSGIAIIPKIGLTVMRDGNARGAQFRTLEEIHASLVADRVVLRAGGGKAEGRGELPLSKGANGMTTRKEARFLQILERFKLSDLDQSGAKILRWSGPMVCDKADNMISHCYLPLIAAMRELAHEALKLTTIEESWDQFSKLLSRAHAGDKGAHHELIMTLKNGLSSDGAKFIADVYVGSDSGSLRAAPRLLVAFAQAGKLPDAERDLCRKELLSFVRDEIFVRDSLESGIPPSKAAVKELIRARGCLPFELKQAGSATAEALLKSGDALGAYQTIRRMQVSRALFSDSLSTDIQSLGVLKRLYLSVISRF